MQKTLTMIQRLFILLTAFFLFGCSNWHFPGVYKLEIDQGNKISAAALKKLEPGMTPRQVIYVLGSPLLQDPLHTDRWDYYSYLLPSGRLKPEVMHIVVYFKDEHFSYYEKR